MVANIVWIWSHLLWISHHCLMRLNSPSCKAFALKGIPHLHCRSSCQWSQGSWLSMDIDVRQMDVCITALPRRLSPIIVWSTIFSYQFMLVINHVKCNTFSERLGTLRILVLTTQLQPYFYDNIFLTPSTKIHKYVFQYDYQTKAHSKPPKAYTQENYILSCATKETHKHCNDKLGNLI